MTVDLQPSDTAEAWLAVARMMERRAARAESFRQPRRAGQLRRYAEMARHELAETV